MLHPAQTDFSSIIPDNWSSGSAATYKLPPDVAD
jgi:hypothetical protein